MFRKSKRFQDTVPQAPPVGSYDIKNQKHGAVSGFGKGQRFAELKDTGEGPTSDISLLDISSCSTSSQNDSKCISSQFVTPLPFRKTTKVSSSTPNSKGNHSDQHNEVSRLLSERTELENRLCMAQQQVQDLKKQFQSLLHEKTCHESSIADLQMEIQDLTEDKDRLLEKVQINPAASSKLETLEGELQTVKLQLHDKEGVISSLKLQLSCAVENSRADLELEQERNKALTERITSSERTVSEVTSDRDAVEEANQRLHELVAQLRNENIELRRKLEETEEKLEDKRTKMENTINESQNKIHALEEMLSKEIMKSKEFGDKLECSLKRSGENFSEAQTRIVRLQEAHDSLESKNRDLEDKLLELIEREHCAEERERCLSVEKLSLESRLEKCESDHTQRLSIANDQVESLQQELQRCEEMMTQNLRSLTGKYQDLEESYTCFQSEAEKEKQLILAELEVTKDSLQKSRQESEQQLNTCVYLKRQSEELQKECDELNQQLDNFKADEDSMKDKLSHCKQEAEAAKAEVKATREELAKHLEETEFTKASLRDSLDEAHSTINDLHHREEGMSIKLQNTLSIQKKQDDELETLKDQLDRYQSAASALAEKVTETEENFTRQIRAFEEKAAKSKEEFGRRLVETQKKLSQKEINFEKLRSEQEMKMNEKNKEMERRLVESQKKLSQTEIHFEQFRSEQEMKINEKNKEMERRLVESQKKLSQTEIHFEKFRSEQEMKMNAKNKEMERKIFSAEEEVNRLKSELSSEANNEDQLNEYKAQIKMWQTKYEELCKKIEPFKDQLDEYEAERNALLCQNSQAKDEVAKLGQQYAKLLGHQNKKQKIQHVVKLKEENIALKSEITKLRDQAEKQRRNMKKLEEKVDQVSGKKKYNPEEAFSHAKKENMPLSVISNGNGSLNS